MSGGAKSEGWLKVAAQGPGAQGAEGKSKKKKKKKKQGKELMALAMRMG